MKHLIFVFALVIGSAVAADPIASAGTGTPRIALGDTLATESIEHGQVVFHNEASSIVRLLLSQEGVACEADGRTTSRSRAGQYTLVAGADLHCTAEPGSYRYKTMTVSGGTIQKATGKLVVR